MSVGEFRINLFHRKKVSLGEKVVYFVLHYLRYIIVLTQIVVIGVFFARFKLDQEIVDLRESVNQKQEILRVTRPLVEQVEAFSYKTGEAAIIIEEQEKLATVVQTVMSSVPKKVILERLSVEKEQVEIIGDSPDVETIRLFFNKLSSYEIFSESTIEDVTKEDHVFTFTISLQR